MNTTMRHFVGGQQARARATTVASNVNSAAAIPAGHPPCRAGASRTATSLCHPARRRPVSISSCRGCQPYLALAAAAGSGLWGIENNIDPGEPIRELVRQETGQVAASRLMEAARRLKASAGARAVSRGFL
jgi:glutamine synthetase